MLHNQVQRNWDGTCPTLAYGRASFKIHSWMQAFSFTYYIHVLSKGTYYAESNLSTLCSTLSYKIDFRKATFFFFEHLSRCKNIQLIWQMNQSCYNIVTNKSLKTQLFIAKSKHASLAHPIQGNTEKYKFSESLLSRIPCHWFFFWFQVFDIKVFQIKSGT